MRRVPAIASIKNSAIGYNILINLRTNKVYKKEKIVQSYCRLWENNRVQLKKNSFVKVLIRPSSKTETEDSFDIEGKVLKLIMMKAFVDLFFLAYTSHENRKRMLKINLIS